MATFPIQFPINVTGQQSLTSVNEAIGRTRQQVNLSKAEWNAWSLAMEKASKEGYTFNTSLAKVQQQLKAVNLDVQAFTDRLRANVRELERSGQGATAFGRAIGGRVLGAELLGGIGVPGGGFIGSQLFGGLGLSGRGAIALGVGGAATFATISLARHIKETTDYAQQQAVLAREVGITASQMDTLSRVANVSHTNLQAVAKTVSMLSEEFTRGGGRAREIGSALERMGLDRSVLYKDTATAMKEIADALTRMSNPAQSTAAAIQLMKESGREFAAIAAQFPNLVDKLTVQQGAIDKLAEVNRQIALLKQYLSEAWVNTLYNILSGRLGLSGQMANALDESERRRGAQRQQGVLSGFAREEAARGDIIKGARERIGTPQDVYRYQVQGIESRQEALVQEYRSGKVVSGGPGQPARLMNQQEFERQFGALEGERLAAYNAMALAMKREGLIRELENMAPPRDEAEVLKLLGELPVRFAIARNSSAYRSWFSYLVRLAISGDAATYSARGFQGQAFLNKITGAAEDTARERLRQHNAIQERSAEVELRSQLDVLRGEEDIQGALIRQRQAGRTAEMIPLRLGLSPLAMATHMREMGLGNIGQDFQARFGILSRRSQLYAAAAEAAPVGSALKVEGLAKSLEALEEIQRSEVDARTKSIEVIGRFNEAVIATAENMRQQFGGFFADFLMGGGRRAVTGFVRGQLGTVLSNVGGTLFSRLRPTGAPGEGEFNWDRMLTGTILGPQGKVQGLPDRSLVAFTSSTLKLDIAADKLIAAAAMMTGTGYSSGGIAGEARNTWGTIWSASPGYFGTDALSRMSQLGPYLPLPSPTTRNEFGTSGVMSIPLPGGGTMGVPLDVIAMAGGGAGGGGGASGAAVSSTTSASGGFLNRLNRGIASAFPYLSIAGGIGGAIPAIMQGAKIGGVRGGAQIASAALGAGALISSGLLSSGVVSAIGGIGTAMAPLIIPAAVAAVAIPMLTSLLGDPKKLRQEEIQRQITNRLYLPPVPMNYSAGIGGGYSDFDRFGNIRESTLSPFPVVEQPLRDWRHDVIAPGRTPAPGGAPGGNTVILNFSAIDVRGFVDHSAEIADSLNHALMTGRAPQLQDTLRNL